MRRMAPPHKDRRIFSETANTTKSVNLSKVTYRGGIRL